MRNIAICRYIFTLILQSDVMIAIEIKVDYRRTMMKTSTFKIVAVAAALALGSSAFAGITDSKHNLSASGPATNNIKASAAESASFNDEICVFCHTPHASNTAFPTVPIWNKATPTGTFIMYGANTNGTVAGNDPDPAPQSPSMACLSCHDGVSGINSIVNAPGSGGYVAAGGYVDFMGAVGSAYAMPAGVTQIGTDLTNDHPVSIVYDDTAASLKPVTTTLLGTWSGATTIADVLRNGRVECVSCHDPHLGNDLTTTFLKRLGANGAANAGSALCLSCHAK